ncbi:MAG: hypothetical protein NDI82_12290 [Anaeromyxobacteraceae bacterium]|nr:hypothetical protein [Anaeromyxobacteraceae bacterium]
MDGPVATICTGPEKPREAIVMVTRPLVSVGPADPSTPPAPTAPSGRPVTSEIAYTITIAPATGPPALTRTST